ncbi:MAG: regulatory iron-sulfur-containing complex subunit RicT [Coriobacteriales bacterium]|jgi:cell fate regulator YaaT (PSP1 superfamily)
MPKTVVPIRFRYNPRTYWFSFRNCDPHPGDWVVVSRDGGGVFGWVEDEPFEISDEQVSSLKSPLSSIVRIANEDDYNKKDELDAKGREAKEVFRELVEKHELDIKPIDVEYLMGADKAIFHFSSEERVDFRELVRDLASRLHVHVDMRQIGVRDEARIVGGLGHCGEELCCVRMSDAFQPVSIRMAKEQDLPLNPSKVSGACGRLMCCLRYEYEAYKDFKSRAPKVNAKIETPMGEAKVIELNTPKELVKIKMADSDDAFYVPLSDLEKTSDEEDAKPDKIGEAAFARNCPPKMLREATFEIPEDEILESSPSKSKRKRRNSKKNGSGQEQAGSRGGAASEPDDSQKQGDKPKNSSKSRRRSRGRKKTASAGNSQKENAQRQNPERDGSQKQKPSSQNPQNAGGGKQKKAKQRPGQNSSNIRKPQDRSVPEGRQNGGQKRSSNKKRRRGGQSGPSDQQKQQNGGANAQSESPRNGQQNSHGGRKPRRTSRGKKEGSSANAGASRGDNQQ